MACPECGNAMAAKGVCGSCGWAPSRGGASADDHWWQCANEYIGQRCAKPGVVSQSTHGDTTVGGKATSGPWYCWWHVPTLVRYEDGKAVPPPMGFDGLRAIIKRNTPQLIVTDVEAIAERLALQEPGV